jgi:hypothetical protein
MRPWVDRDTSRTTGSLSSQSINYSNTCSLFFDGIVANVSQIDKSEFPSKNERLRSVPVKCTAIVSNTLATGDEDQHPRDFGRRRNRRIYALCVPRRSSHSSSSRDEQEGSTSTSCMINADVDDGGGGDKKRA